MFFYYFLFIKRLGTSSSSRICGTRALKLCKNTKNNGDKQKTSAIFALFKRNECKNGG